METLDSHVKFILHRNFVEIFAISGGRIQLAGIHLKNSDVLGFGLPIQIVLLNTRLNTIHVSLAAGDIKGIAVEHILMRFLVGHLDVQVIADLGQLFKAGNGRILFLLGHQPVVFLEKLLPFKLHLLGRGNGLPQPPVTSPAEPAAAAMDRPFIKDRRVHLLSRRSGFFQRSSFFFP